MEACNIMHHMIVKDGQHYDFGILDDHESIQPLLQVMIYHEFVQGTTKFEDADTFYNLRGHLIEYHWKQFG